MTTIYNTTRGPTADPLPIDVWHFDGAAPAGRLAGVEGVTLTWADGTTGTSELDVTLNPSTAGLLPCDGTRLIVGTLNGKRHVTAPVVANPYHDGDGDTVHVKVTGASPWNLFTGELLPPVPDMPIELQATAEDYVVTGPVETVVKTIIGYGVERTGHPVHVLPDQGRGPVVTATSRFDTVADVLDGLTTRTGYRIDVDVWLPGDPPVNGTSFAAPTVIVDVVPYRAVDGLLFSHVAGDFDDWSVEYTRPTATRVIVGDDGEGVEQTFIEVAGPTPLSPWAVREAYVSADEDDDPVDVGRAYLAEHGAGVAAEATITPGSVWEFGTDGQYPRQYDLGDLAALDLGEGVGTIEQVVVEVVAELDGESFSVTPKVATPDTLEHDLYSTVADLARRVARQERR